MFKRQKMLERGRAALREVARQEGISVAEVRKEINIAIAEAMRTEDPKAKALWRSLFPEGYVPTPEEFIVVVAGVVQKQEASQINNNPLLS